MNAAVRKMGCTWSQHGAASGLVKLMCRTMPTSGVPSTTKNLQHVDSRLGCLLAAVRSSN
jgi:hypothetical protein